jgi:uncharacterized protein YcnI
VSEQHEIHLFPLGKLGSSFCPGTYMIAALLAGLLMSYLVTAAWGHIDLDPRQSLSKRWETYTVRIPNETQAPTVKIHVVVPEAFEIEMVEHSEVWHIETSRDDRGFVRELTWSGGRIPPQTFGEVKFLARNPEKPGLYNWQFTQYDETGDAAPWKTQTRIITAAGAGGERAEEAWRAAQAATTLSFIAIGVSLALILVTLLGIVRTGRPPAPDQEG